MQPVEPVRRSTRALSLRLAAVAVGMFGFGFLLVPLYDLLCDITGIGGRTSDAVAAVPTRADVNRTVTVEFIATVNEYAPWEFRPVVASMEVRPGQLNKATFTAHNLSNRALTGQAIPSVTPNASAKYLKKTDCFCFRSQDFAPEETRELTVQFYIDPAMPEYVDRVTLSYTMFVKPGDGAATAAATRS